MLALFSFFSFCLLPWAWKLPLLITAVFGARSIKMRGKDFFRNFDIEIHIASVTIEKRYFMYNNKYQGYKIECITWLPDLSGFRCNMSHSCEFFASAAMARTIFRSCSNQPGCNSDPFFQIPIDNVVLDELHLMLRITDKLEQGLILDILKRDTGSWQ